MKRQLIISAITLMLTACGGGDDSSINPSNTITTDQEVGLLEEWTSETGLAKIEDTSTQALKSLWVGRGDVYKQYSSNGDKCFCSELEFFGTETSGSFARTRCGASAFNINGSLDCNALNITGTYTKTADTLLMIPSSGSSITYTSIVKSLKQGKGLREEWNSSDGLAKILDTSTHDLRSLAKSTGAIYSQFLANGEKCICSELEFFGTESSGSFARTICGRSTTNLDCKALNTTGNYTKSSDTLTITSESGTSLIFN